MTQEITTPIKIRVAMLPDGISQARLAKKLGISRQALNRHLRPNADMKLSFLRRIAKALNVDPRTLI